MSSPAANILGDITLPGLHFEPLDDEIVRLYLLPRIRGRPDLFPGLIIDDDTAANTQPWTLFGRHGLPDQDGAQAFFFVHAPNGRRCQGGGTWKSQKINHEMAAVHGEKVKWSRHNLNFHMDTESGSWGWVMHEYTVAGSSSLKLCSISFSGHGQKRKRVPDEYLAGESATQRPRVASGESRSGTTAATFDQGFSTTHASSDDEIAAEMVAEMAYDQRCCEFEAEQVQQTMNASSSTPQAIQPPSSTTTTVAQDGAVHPSGGFQHVADVQGIAAMIAEMTDADLYLERVPMMDQSSCGVPDIGDTDAVHWEGIDLTFSYDEDNSVS